MSTTVQVDSVLRVLDCPRRLADALMLATRRVHPSAVAAERGGRPYQGNRFHHSAVGADGNIMLPRGMLPLLRRTARECGVELRWDSRVVGDSTLGRADDSIFAREPRAYQSKAIDALVDGVQGILVLPCGGGKTTVGASAAIALGQSTLIIVHTRDLVEQWVDTLRAVAGTDELNGHYIRVLGAGNHPSHDVLKSGEVCVAMVHALSEAPAVLATAAVVIVDECHHASARMWADVLAQCPARWRWGLTATPERADGWGFVMFETFGSILYQRTTAELIADGHLRRPLVIPVRVEWAPPLECFHVEVRCAACGRETTTTRQRLDTGEAVCRARKACGEALTPEMEAKRGRMIWSAALSSWAESIAMRSALRSIAVAGHAAHRRILALVPRRGTAYDVTRQLSRAGITTEAITGDSRAREHTIEGLRSGRLDAMVGTQLADEGLDIAEADLLIMASCGKAEGLTQQRGGRICRPAGHERPVIYDLVGDGLRHQWIARRRAYTDAYGASCLASEQPLPLDEAISLLPV